MFWQELCEEDDSRQVLAFERPTYTPPWPLCDIIVDAKVMINEAWSPGQKNEKHW